MNDRDRYYQILGLTTTATPAQVKQAYRKLALQWHPDRFIDRPHLQALAQQEISKINQAYAILKDAPSLPETEGQVNRDRVVQTTKDTAEIHYQRGVEFAEAEAYEKAIAEFTVAIKINNNYLKAYQYRGFILSKLGYELRATNDFDTVASLKRKQKYGSPVKQSRYRSPDLSRKKYRRNGGTNNKLTNNKLSIALLFLFLIVALTILF